jgi:mitochondrial fission protein ELM1
MTAFASSTEQDVSAGCQVQPRVWVVLSDKRGDNGQVETVEKALGWQCAHRYVHMREPYVFGKPKIQASLHHLDLSRSDALEPPWPDLILTIGRRPSMVALWIREQAGGRTKIVLLGKPSGRLELYDLIIASAENQLPPLSNVLPISWPLMRVSEDAVAAAATTWRPRFAALPRPLIGIMVGGPTGPFIFNASVADRLRELAAGVVRDMGGTPYITTSRRTPGAAVAALKARMPRGAELFDWTGGAAENPYLGLLGLADGFVVTGDSVSMLVEVAQLGKPLAILTPPRSWVGALDQLRRSFSRRLFAPSGGTAGGRRRQGLGRMLYRSGLLTQTRDFAAFHQFLIDRGLAVRAGDGFAPPRGSVPDDLPLVVARIKALVQGRPGADQNA